MAIKDLTFTVAEVEPITVSIDISHSLPLTTKISQSSTKARTHRVLKSQFGNGYAQMTPDGINHKIDSWNLVWNNLITTDRDTLWTFIDKVGGSQEWTWTAPGDVTQKYWIIDGDVSESAQSGNVYSISFKAKQAF